MKDFDEIMEELLSRVPEEVDQRVGGVIYTALVPVAAQLAEQQAYLGTVRDATMLDTAAGDDLTRRAAENGVNRSGATFAVRRGIFNAPNQTKTDVPIGAQFGAEGIRYRATKKLIVGEFELTCETAGTVGNRYFGAILPIDSVQNLGSAMLSDVRISGEEAETDDQLRLRYYKKVNQKAFGGNVAQYEQELLALDGVGGVAVFPTPGEQGGRVHCVIVTAENKPVSAALLAGIQNSVDPEPHGKGYGIAPCCHFVTISTVVERAVNVSASVAPARDYTIPALQAEIERVISDYLASVAFRDNVVRVSKIEAEIMGVKGVADIAATTLNGIAANLVLPNNWNSFEVPMLGTVTLSEVV